MATSITWLPFPSVIVDLETTGLDPDQDRITEVAIHEPAARSKKTKSWSTLVNPGLSIPGSVQALTGITDGTVAAAPSFRDLAETLQPRLASKLIVAHNAEFDYALLKAEFSRAGISWSAETLCTAELASALFPEIERPSLDLLIDRLGLPAQHRHRALSDAQTVWHFLEAISLRFPEDRLRTLVHHLLVSPPAADDSKVHPHLRLSSPPQRVK